MNACTASAYPAQERQLIVAVDAFGDNPQAEILGQRDDRSDQGPALLIIGHLLMHRARA